MQMPCSWASGRSRRPPQETRPPVTYCIPPLSPSGRGGLPQECNNSYFVCINTVCSGVRFAEACFFIIPECNHFPVPFLLNMRSCISKSSRSDGQSADVRRAAWRFHSQTRARSCPSPRVPCTGEGSELAGRIGNAVEERFDVIIIRWLRVSSSRSFPR
jgi:hypothetical protein